MHSALQSEACDAHTVGARCLRGPCAEEGFARAEFPVLAGRCWVWAVLGLGGARERLA